jgi:hypothetical protein
MMILKGVFVNSIEKEQASLLVQKKPIMVEKLISFSLKNRAIVLLVSACLFGWESIACKKIPLMRFLIYQKIRLLFLRMGRSPQVIEDQVTYPLVSLQVFLKSKISGFFHVWDEFYLHHF